MAPGHTSHTNIEATRCFRYMPIRRFTALMLLLTLTPALRAHYCCYEPCQRLPLACCRYADIFITLFRHYAADIVTLMLYADAAEDAILLFVVTLPLMPLFFAILIIAAADAVSDDKRQLLYAKALLLLQYVRRQYVGALRQDGDVTPMPYHHMNIRRRSMLRVSIRREDGHGTWRRADDITPMLP